MRTSLRVKYLTMVLSALLGTAVPAAAQKPINQAKANAGNVTPGDAAGFPVTISTPGSYKLTGNLKVTDPNKHAIHITADHVTLDLNGFNIDGPTSPGTGSGIHGEEVTNIVVVNGSVVGFGSAGVDFIGGGSHRIEKVHVSLNGTRGILVAGNSVVTGCTALFNGYAGITVFSGTVTGNTADLNGVYGISAGSATVVNNSAKQNGSHGLYMDPNGGYAHNVFAENNHGGAQVTGGVQMGVGTNICNGAPCP